MFFMSGIFQIIFPLVFILVIGTIIFRLASEIKEWSKNNNSPRLTVDATVVSKRTEVTNRHHNNNDDLTYQRTTSTRYYVTFEVESGDRMELHITGREYGMLVEHDTGKLTFQGTRYLDFTRN